MQMELPPKDNPDKEEEGGNELQQEAACDECRRKQKGRVFCRVVKRHTAAATPRVRKERCDKGTRLVNREKVLDMSEEDKHDFVKAYRHLQSLRSAALSLKGFMDDGSVRALTRYTPEDWASDPAKVAETLEAIAQADAETAAAEAAAADADAADADAANADTAK
jgi:hypothetical protein